MLDAFYAGGVILRDDVPAVLAMLNEYNVIADATALVESYTNDAFAHLHTLPASPARDLLESLGRQLMDRRS
jgi:geranylgeranyl pyrophosphate synthase